MADLPDETDETINHLEISMQDSFLDEAENIGDAEHMRSSLPDKGNL